MLEQDLDIERLRAALGQMQAQKIVYRLLSRPTPFSLPLMIERLREQVTTEKLGARIERMIADLERAAVGHPEGPLHTRCCVHKSGTPISCIAFVRGSRMSRRVSEGKTRC